MCMRALLEKPHFFDHNTPCASPRATTRSSCIGSRSRSADWEPRPGGLHAVGLRKPRPLRWLSARHLLDPDSSSSPNTNALSRCSEGLNAAPIFQRCGLELPSIDAAVHSATAILAAAPETITEHHSYKSTIDRIPNQKADHSGKSIRYAYSGSSSEPGHPCRP